ncbi:MAG: penicillin-binding protein [Chitinophagales bacterium]
MKGSNKKREVMVRIYIGFVFIALLGAGIIFKAAQTQIYDGPALIAHADSLTIFPKKVEAERGNIYSCDGKLLASSLPIFDVHIDFNADGLTDKVFSNQNVDSVAMMMAETFGDKSKEDYRREFVFHRKKKDAYYLLKRNISLAELNAMKQWPWFRQSKNTSGMIVETKEWRDHPFGDIALRTLGSDENHDGIYSSGVELKYNKDLSGLAGMKLYRKLSGGASKPLDTKDDVASQSGRDIYTTIDVNLQDVAEDALRRSLTSFNAEHGCAILMEVKTGKIRAIANLGRKDSANYKELFNYAIGEATEPGSTFKLATVAALMEDGLVNENTSVDCENGVKQFYNLTIKDHEAPETPSLSLKRAIEVSSNVAIAKLAFANYSAKPSKFYDHLKAFGFTEPVSIELGGSARPVLAPAKKWSGVSSAFIAHGYEVQVSALHTLQFYNAIANGGVMVKPTLIEKIREYNTTVDSPGAMVLNEHLLSEKTVKALRDILEGVVANGTARNLKNDYLQIAGKTGTAVISNHGYRGNKKYQASFVGYFPAEKPEYSMIVVVNSPSNGVYYGNVVAGTVFREVADKVYSISLDMHRPVNTGQITYAPQVQSAHYYDVEKIYAQFGFAAPAVAGEWVKASGDKQFAANEMKANTVPDVVGMGLKDALYLLESRGLKVQFEGNGNVRRQSINAGEKINKGSTIKILLG